MLPGSDKNRVGVRCGFIRQGGDVKAAEKHVRATPAVVVSDLIRAIGVGDVNLNDHQVRLVVQGEPLDVLVVQGNLQIRIEIRGERGQTKRGKQRVLDRPPIRTRRFGQGRKNELDAPH
jgi:hypothetical protein